MKRHTKGLEKTLQELERTDPEVGRAKAKLDAVVAKILATPKERERKRDA